MWVPRFERIEESMAGWDGNVRSRASFSRRSPEAESMRKEAVKQKCMSGFQSKLMRTSAI